ncbi:MAG: hypothetical protein AABZ80_06715 [Gemmatimonadota bacterium]
MPALIAISALLAPLSSLPAQERLDRGRLTFFFSPQDRQLAGVLAQRSLATDTFPGLPRSAQKVIITIAPDRRRFRDLVGDVAPEWGSAVAFPESRRIVIQGQGAGSDAGNPVDVLRHELAHLALFEFLGNRTPRWFDEGYASFAAGEWGRQEILATNVALALRGMPTLHELEDSFGGGATAAQSAYALAYSAVSELSRMGGPHGMSLFLGYWRRTTMERAMRQAYGVTLSGFEGEWRRHTRRQYGGLALASNLALAGLLLLFVLTPFYIARRRRDRQRLEKMREADAIAEKAERSAIDDLISGL